MVDTKKGVIAVKLKKFLAVMLASITVISCFAVNASAVGNPQNEDETLIVVRA